ncbi:hypothetical protein BLNAU_3410 [Blattamonas nauphoetae]|uniref:Protein kinase domain-containing protein n=1 Tax=Blattamonas nauphoetae TaxID=2049346 RepID=A0ABQ9YCZ5_9EUKA|nr:hypothetical protein BLNAU_3410 [Blattamonas nauphoetae]
MLTIFILFVCFVSYHQPFHRSHPSTYSANHINSSFPLHSNSEKQPISSLWRFLDETGLCMFPQDIHDNVMLGAVRGDNIVIIILIIIIVIEVILIVVIFVLKCCVNTTPRELRDDQPILDKDEDTDEELRAQRNERLVPTDITHKGGTLLDRRRRLPRPPPPRNPYFVPCLRIHKMPILEERDGRGSLFSFLHSAGAPNPATGPLTFDCFADNNEMHLFIAAQICECLRTIKEGKATRRVTVSSQRVHPDADSSLKYHNRTQNLQFEPDTHNRSFGSFSSYSVVIDQHSGMYGDNEYSVPVVGLSLASISDHTDPNSQTAVIHQASTASYEAQRWRAPESTSDTIPHSLEADVFSFGMVMYELLTGLIPFHEVDAVSARRNITHGLIPTVDSATNQIWSDLVVRSLSFVPSDRPVLEEIQEELELMIGQARYSFLRNSFIFDDSDSIPHEGNTTAISVVSVTSSSQPKKTRRRSRQHTRYEHLPPPPLAQHFFTQPSDGTRETGSDDGKCAQDAISVLRSSSLSSHLSEQGRGSQEMISLPDPPPPPDFHEETIPEDIFEDPITVSLLPPPPFSPSPAPATPSTPSLPPPPSDPPPPSITPEYALPPPPPFPPDSSDPFGATDLF